AVHRYRALFLGFGAAAALSPTLRVGDRAGRCAPRSGAAARLGDGPVTLPSPASLRSARN
ncbi:hypothetical protein LQ379_20825, partial [Rhodococcus rhodochrous]|uniref:hypothetical protein n=1 Tax=Rhodococcus rhodochrous TaxID=1829 RepID=UPI001E3E3066